MFKCLDAGMLEAMWPKLWPHDIKIWLKHPGLRDGDGQEVQQQQQGKSHPGDVCWSVPEAIWTEGKWRMYKDYRHGDFPYCSCVKLPRGEMGRNGYTSWTDNQWIGGWNSPTWGKRWNKGEHPDISQKNGVQLWQFGSKPGNFERSILIDFIPYIRFNLINNVPCVWFESRPFMVGQLFGCTELLDQVSQEMIFL